MTTKKLDPIPALPSQYQTRVEIKMVEKKEAIEMQLFYDYNARRAAVEVKGENKYEKLIFNYETNEIYELKCKQVKSYYLI
jgi:hypothetical protein